jgi:large subunit ribosomal protein L7/L12
MTTMAESNFDKLIEQIEKLTVLELSELVKALEEKFGVSAAAPMMMGAMPAAGAAADAEPAEEKTSFTVVLTDGGANKINAIKAVREVRQDLGLKEAKDLVDGAPKNVLENVKKDEADAAVEKLKAAGATVEVK